RLAARVMALGGRARRAVVWGGETTVRVGEASGLGGRSQELALRAGVDLSGRAGVGVIAFGTDGIDGPTDAAGAVVDGASASRMARGGVDGETALLEHDSHRALERSGSLIRTGPSGTNVNDLMIGVSGGAWGR
ncbi:MAG: MOFRL family protein, partial [Phycisphaerales bacterium JB059]